MPAVDESSVDSLRAYLLSKIRKHSRLAIVRRLIAWVLLVMAFFAAALVVVNVGTKWFNADQLSALTGTGAIILGFLKAGKFQEQAGWNKLKQRKLEEVYRKLVYENVDPKLVSALLTEVNEELEKVRVWLEVPGDLSTLVPAGASEKKAAIGKGA